MSNEIVSMVRLVSEISTEINVILVSEIIVRLVSENSE